MKPINNIENLRFICNTESPDTPRYQWASKLFKSFVVRENMSEKLRREEVSLPYTQIIQVSEYVDKPKKKWSIMEMIRSVLP